MVCLPLWENTSRASNVPYIDVITTTTASLTNDGWVWKVRLRGGSTGAGVSQRGLPLVTSDLVLTVEEQVFELFDDFNDSFARFSRTSDITNRSRSVTTTSKR